MTNKDEIRIDVPATYKYLNVISAVIAGILEHENSLQEKESLVMGIQVAVHEICTNVIQHAYKDIPGRITLVFAIQDNPGRLVVNIYDTGVSFEMGEIRQPNVDEIQTNGYGLFLVHSLMDKVSYYPQPGNNSWLLVKNL